ncbi:MAG: ABC transporter ATP-binding protein [Sedimentisphaerales bacterium]|jgi:ATP-binding cassette subfamily B protein
MKSCPKRSLLQSYKILFAARWRKLIAIFVVYLIKASPAWLLPIITAFMIDLAAGNDPKRVSKLLFYFIFIILLTLQNIPTHILYSRMLSSVMRGISLQLRTDLCRQLQRLSLLYHNKSNIGKLHTKVIRDIEIVEQTPRLIAEQIFGFLCQVTIAVIAIAVRKPIALLFFIVVVPIAVIIRNIFSEKISESAKSYRYAIEAMSSSMNDMLNMIPITRAHGLEEFEVSQIDSKISAVFRRGFYFDTLSAVFGSSAWVIMSVIHITFITGSAFACMKGYISVGDIVLFNSMFLVLTGQTLVVIGTLPQLSQAGESIDSIYEVLESPDLEVNSGKKPFDKISGKIEFVNVNYQYPSTNRHALKDFTLTVEPGQSVAFVGPSGSGKSTVLSLALGFIRPNSGKLLIDGKDIMEMDLRTYRKFVGVVTQDSIFFSASIYENVSYGDKDTSPQEVIDALKAADAWDFVEALPDGIYTNIGADGLKLSGGQMQRLAIARVIIRDPKVIILDEATSSLDIESEERVRIALDRIMKNRTTFIVAHRVSTIKNVDRIVILKNGRITEQGSPSELLQKDNFYSRIVH